MIDYKGWVAIAGSRPASHVYVETVDVRTRTFSHGYIHPLSIAREIGLDAWDYEPDFLSVDGESRGKFSFPATHWRVLELSSDEAFEEASKVYQSDLGWYRISEILPPVSESRLQPNSSDWVYLASAKYWAYPVTARYDYEKDVWIGIKNPATKDSGEAVEYEVKTKTHWRYITEEDET